MRAASAKAGLPANGRTPATAGPCIIARRAVCRVDHLRTALAHVKAPSKPGASKSDGFAPIVLSGNYESIDANDPRLAALGDKWKQMGPDGECYSEYGNDRSRAVMAFATACARAGIADDVLASLLMTWNIGQHVRDQLNVLRALTRTIKRAKNRVSNPDTTSGLSDEAASFKPGDVAPNTAATTAASPAAEIAPPLVPFDASDLPEIPWVIEGMVARRNSVMLVGPGGVSKSTLLMQLAVGLVTGRSDICQYRIDRRQRVWMLNQEDDLDQMKRCLAAVMQAFNVSWDDLRDETGELMLRLRSGIGGDRLSLVEPDGRNGFKAGRDLAAAIASIKRFRADFVTLDPLLALHPANEQDNAQMRAVMDVLVQIPVEGDCAAVIAHHTPKPDRATNQSFAGDVRAARGASAIVDAARGTMTFMEMSEADTKKWKLPSGDAYQQYVRLDDARMSRGPMRRDPLWFKRESVPLGGNARKAMPVLRPANLPRIGPVARQDLLHNIAKAIFENLELGVPHVLTAIHPYLKAADVAVLTGNNKAAKINAAFDGAVEYLTDVGKLTRSKVRGNVGTKFTLVAAPSASKA